MDDVTIFDSALETLIIRGSQQLLDGYATSIEAAAKSNCPVRTGRLRDSIEIRNDGPTARLIGTDLYYAIYVEKGTSRMAAQPFLRPALYRTHAAKAAASARKARRIQGPMTREQFEKRQQAKADRAYNRLQKRREAAGL